MSFGMWHEPRGCLSNFFVRPASSLVATGRSGSLSRQSRGIDPRVEFRRGEVVQIKLSREMLCSSRVRQVCWGTFCVASRVSSTISNFKRESGISLQTLQREEASSHDDGGTSWFSQVVAVFSSYDRELREPLMLPQGCPISIRVARGSWGLLSSHCTANKPHLGFCLENPCSSPMATGISVLHSRFTRGVRPRLEWKQRILLSFPIAMGVSWSP